MGPRMIQDGFMGLETAHKRYRARRRALGLCSAHGCKEKLVNKTHCETHRVIHNARMKEWMRKKKDSKNRPTV